MYFCAINLNNEGYGQEVIILQLLGGIKAFRGETLED